MYCRYLCTCKYTYGFAPGFYLLCDQYTAWDGPWPDAPDSCAAVDPYASTFCKAMATVSCDVAPVCCETGFECMKSVVALDPWRCVRVPPPSPSPPTPPQPPIVPPPLAGEPPLRTDFPCSVSQATPALPADTVVGHYVGNFETFAREGRRCENTSWYETSAGTLHLTVSADVTDDRKRYVSGTLVLRTACTSEISSENADELQQEHLSSSASL